MQEEEAYICIYSHRTADTILFHHEGGVDIGDVDSKALKLDVPVGAELPDEATITNTLLKHISADKKPSVKLNLVLRSCSFFFNHNNLLFLQNHCQIRPGVA